MRTASTWGWDPRDQDCCLGWSKCPVGYNCPSAPPHRRTYNLGGALFTIYELDDLLVLKAGYLKYWGGPDDGKERYGDTTIGSFSGPT